MKPANLAKAKEGGMNVNNKLVGAFLLLVSMMLALSSGATSKADADKATAEKIFWEVHQALVIWPDALDQGRAELIRLQQLSAKNVVIVIITPTRYSDHYRFKTDKHVFTKKAFCALIQRQIDFIDRWVKSGRSTDWVDPVKRSQTESLMVDWLKNYFSNQDERHKPKRSSLSEWVIKSGTMPELQAQKQAYYNRVKLTKENNQWKLYELQIYWGTLAWGD